MKRKSALFLACLLLLGLTAGCGNGQGQTVPQGTPGSLTEEEGDNSMDNIVLSDQEIALLGAAYPDAQRIENGQLFDYQVDGLHQLRAGMAYLEEKYPQSNLQVISFQPASQFTQWAELTFQDDSGNTGCRLTVTPSGTGFDCADDYYGVLLRASYDQRIADVLAQGGFSVRAYTSFPSPMGMEVGAGTSVDDLIQLGSQLTRNTHLFAVLSGGQQSAASEMQAQLLAEGFYGSFTLYFVPELLEDAAALEASRDGLDYVTFNCFHA